MGTDLQSGDTSDASSLVTDILAHAPGSSSESGSSTGGSSGGSSVGDQITQLSQIAPERAFFRRNERRASSVLTELMDYLAKNAPAQPAVSGTYSSDGTVTFDTSPSEQRPERLGVKCLPSQINKSMKGKTMNVSSVSSQGSSTLSAAGGGSVGNPKRNCIVSSSKFKRKTRAKTALKPRTG